MFLLGTINDEFNVYCNDSNICYISCLSSDACSNLYLHCLENATCFVECDENKGINCPLNGTYVIITFTTTSMNTTDFTTTGGNSYVNSNMEVDINSTISTRMSNSIVNYTNIAEATSETSSEITRSDNDDENDTDSQAMHSISYYYSCFLCTFTCIMLYN